MQGVGAAVNFEPHSNSDRKYRSVLFSNGTVQLGRWVDLMLRFAVPRDEDSTGSFDDGAVALVESNHHGSAICATTPKCVTLIHPNPARSSPSAVQLENGYAIGFKPPPPSDDS